MKNWQHIIDNAVRRFNREAQEHCKVVCAVTAHKDSCTPGWFILCHRRVASVQGEHVSFRTMSFPVYVLPFLDSCHYLDLGRHDTGRYEWDDVDTLCDIIRNIGEDYPDADGLVPHLYIMESSLRRLLYENDVQGNHEAIVHYLASDAYHILTLMERKECQPVVQSWLCVAKEKVRHKLPHGVPEWFSLVQTQKEEVA